VADIAAVRPGKAEMDLFLHPNLGPRRVHGIQAVAIGDPVDCHLDCHAGGMYETGWTDQRPA